MKGYPKVKPEKIIATVGTNPKWKRKVLMHKKVIVALMLLCLVGTLSLFAQGSAETKVYNLRTSTNLAPGGTVGKALTYFVELVNKEADGRIKATANYGSELGSQREQVEMAQTGSLEMVVAAPGTGPGVWVPELMMFEFPYLFKDNNHYLRVLKGLENEVSRLVQPHGFTAAAGQSMGSRHMLTNKPINQLSDLKGLKMRGPNAVYISMFNRLGASGTTTDWNEIYNAISTGVIDGMEASPSMIYSMRFHEVAKYMAVTNHITAAVYYFFNTDWLESLPEDLRAIVLDCADKAAAYQAEIDQADQTAALDKMVAEGLVVTTPRDPEAFVKAASPMLAEYRAKGANWAGFIDKMTAID
jgi:C4-dicarboxylate-binding protein DctP